MIRISVEVRSEGLRSEIAVWAESIENALNLARANYPSSEVSVIFPIEPEGFFMDATAPLSEAVHPGVPRGVPPRAPEQAV